MMIFIRLSVELPSDSIGILVFKYLATDTEVGVCHQRMRGLRLLAAICISADASLRLAKRSNFGRSLSIRKLLYDNAKLFIVFTTLHILQCALVFALPCFSHLAIMFVLVCFT